MGVPSVPSSCGVHAFSSRFTSRLSVSGIASLRVMPIGSVRYVRPCRASAVRPPRLSPGHGLGLRIRQRTARIPSHPRAKAGFKVRTLTLAWLYIETLPCVVGGALEALWHLLPCLSHAVYTLLARGSLRDCPCQASHCDSFVCCRWRLRNPFLNVPFQN